MGASDVMSPASSKNEPGSSNWIKYYFRYGWVKIKDSLSININTDKNFFPADAARKIITENLPSGVKITCAGRRDGVGMQTLAKMSGLAFARAFGATYVHTPFEWLGHCDRDMAQWVEAWEDLFGLGRGELSLADGGLRAVDYVDYFRGVEPLETNTVLRFQQCYWLTRNAPDMFSNVIPDLQKKYGLQPRRRPPCSAVVAIHVRRGDVTPDRPAGRYTRNEVILRSLHTVKRIAEDMGIACLFDLYSEGAPEEFHGFKAFGCNLHINADALWTMRRLIESDILVMSKSSFSYVAALINDGIKLYEPCANPGLSHWIARRANGAFDEFRFRQKLREFHLQPGLPKEPATL